MPWNLLNTLKINYKKKENARELKCHVTTAVATPLWLTGCQKCKHAGCQTT